MAEVGCGGDSGMDSRSYRFLVESFGDGDTCHHPDEGQILTITDKPAFSLVGV